MNDEWLSQVREAIIDPDREIVDPHHHLWSRPTWEYELKELWADTSDGHNVVQTVYLECGSSYYPDGPEELMSVGETVYVANIAKASQEDPNQASIAGIVAQADLRHPDLDRILAAHLEASDQLFRGIRHSGACDPHPEALTIPGRAPADLYTQEEFRRGVRRLGELGYSYDTWHYHHQNAAFCELAKACPETPMILDHFGTPLGVGPYAGKREEIFDAWRKDIEAIASCPNVNAKLGGLAMPDNGFGWNNNDRPPSSDEFVEHQARYYHHAIGCFGPERCMFESNFPVDRLSLSYHVLWNGLKKIAARYDDHAQQLIFSGTARRVYRLGA
ncbi:MAG: amidohydrolase family protein [Pseudomonadota bacterium]